MTWSTDGADDGAALYPAAQRAAFVLPEPASSDWRSLVAVLMRKLITQVSRTKPSGLS